MRITFPHIGNFHIALKHFLRELGHEVIPPPPTSSHTASLGARYAPESACYPLKLTMGNLIQGISQGADSVFMAGGIGPCRFGFYAQLQRHVLAALGHSVEFLILEPPAGGLTVTAASLKKLLKGVSLGQLVRATKGAWLKCVAIDDLERAAALLRAREAAPGSVDRVLAGGLESLDTASSERDISSVWQECLCQMRQVPRCRTHHAPPVVGIVGEIFMVLDSFANKGVERKLGAMGIQVVRFLRASEWVKSNLFPVCAAHDLEEEILKAAQPYTTAFFGGHGRESVGAAALMCRRNVDGLVHVMPFTCMPEIAASAMLQSLEAEYRVPVLRLSLDEHTAEVGFNTRLEAFADLVHERSSNRWRNCTLE
ncbi:MAG: acyl-CoA dehydratase activase-related protein [Bacillota bacterium]